MNYYLILLLRRLAYASAKCGGPYANYDAACQGIIDCGQAAARAHNTKKDASSSYYLREAESAFAVAFKFDDQDAQAFANLATLQLNTHQFEKAIESWLKTSSRLPQQSKAWNWAKEREHYSRLGLASANRDKFYASGNMSESLRWTLQQRELVPNSPRVAYDLATLYSTNDDIDLAEYEYKQSQEFAARAASKFYFDNLFSWTLYLVSEEVDKIQIVSLSQTLIAGPDGVIVQADQGILRIRSEAPWIPIHANLWLDEQAWRPNALTKIPYDHSKRRQFLPITTLTGGVHLHFQDALSILCFAATNFYHFLTDVVPRLVYILLNDDRNTSTIIVPAVSKRLWRLYEIIAGPDTISRLHPVDVEVSTTPPGPRIQVDELRVLEIPRVLATDGRPTHALMPSSLLIQAQNHILHTLFSSSSSAKSNKSFLPQRVVYASRRGSSSRRFRNETIFLKSLRNHLADVEDVDVYDFDGTDTDIDAAIRLFASATVVIGVHGAGLANILWCTPENTRLVIELGFKHAQVRHYEHLASSLGLSYRRFFLESHPAAFAAKFVDVSQDTADHVVSAVRQAIILSSPSLVMATDK